MDLEAKPSSLRSWTWPKGSGRFVFVMIVRSTLRLQRARVLGFSLICHLGIKMHPLCFSILWILCFLICCSRSVLFIWMISLCLVRLNNSVSNVLDVYWIVFSRTDWSSVVVSVNFWWLVLRSWATLLIKVGCMLNVTSCKDCIV
jgi:hypothetical protein